jgi:hypothetical protein
LVYWSRCFIAECCLTLSNHVSSSVYLSAPAPKTLTWLSLTVFERWHSMSKNKKIKGR